MPAIAATTPRGAGLRVYTSGQKRGVTDQIQRELRRRSAVEPVIGHLKAEHRVGRDHLAGRSGDAINAAMAAIGRTFRLLVAWLAALLSARSRYAMLGGAAYAQKAEPIA